MIETLCLAAECTTVVLLLSLAMERAVLLRSLSKTTVSQSPANPEKNDLIQGIVGLHLNSLHSQDALIQGLHSLADRLPERCRDGTDMYLRSTLTHVLSHLAQQPWPPQFALLELDDLANQQEELGLVGAQQYGNDIAKEVVRLSRKFAFPVRINAHRFILAIPNTSNEHARELVRSFHAGLAQKPWKLGKQDRPCTLCFSLCPLDPGLDENALLDRSEAGLLIAQQHGRHRGVIWEEGQWLEMPSDSNDSPLPTCQEKSGDTPVNEQAAPPPAPEPIASQSPSPDDNAKVDSDDIAALFATVQPRAATPTRPIGKSEAPPIEPSASTSQNDLVGSASADHIAALVAANNTKPAPQAAPATEAKSEGSNPPNASTPLVDLNGTASADDIQALFAAARSSVTT
jgi:GGDEF domain-containing protein